MAEVPDIIKKMLENYIELLKINNVPVKEMFLFGSYAQGTFTEYSDIDIALVSTIFEGIRFLDRNKIRKINLSVSSDFEVLPFNPKDFTDANPFVKEIMETGVKII